MGGIVGRFFREFAVTLSAAILVSLVVSLTTTPMMCARLLVPAAKRRAGRFHDWSERGFEGAAARLRADAGLGAATTVRSRCRSCAATVALNVFLYVIIPKGFFPQQDTGRLMGRIQADQSISFQAMRQKLADFIDIVRADPAVENVVGFTGGSQRNTGVDVRHAEAARRARRERGQDRRAAARAARAGARRQSLPQPGPGHPRRRPAEPRQYQYTIQADDLDELRAWEPRIREALSQPARARRRQHRPAEQGTADVDRHRPRRRGAPRRHARSRSTPR